MAGVRITEIAKDHALQMVRESGGRVTLPTRAVIAILSDSDDHLTADDIIAELDRRSPGIAPSTVYRVIQRLGELDVIGHVHTGIGPPVYHLRARSHAHLVCSVCHAIADVPERELDAMARSLRRNHGFVLDAHHSALLGLCSTCAAAREASSSASADS